MGFFGGFECLLPHRLKTQAEFLRLESGEDFLFERSLVIRHGRVRWNRKSDRRQIAEAIAPHLLPGGECDERLGRATMLLPVIIILLADFVSERKACIPFARAFGLLDTGEIRHERAIGPRHFHRHDAVNAKRVRRLQKIRARFRQKITQRNFIAGLHPQIVREPLTHDDLVIAQI